MIKHPYILPHMPRQWGDSSTWWLGRLFCARRTEPPSVETIRRVSQPGTWVTWATQPGWRRELSLHLPLLEGRRYLENSWETTRARELETTRTRELFVTSSLVGVTTIGVREWRFTELLSRLNLQLKSKVNNNNYITSYTLLWFSQAATDPYKISDEKWIDPPPVFGSDLYVGMRVVEMFWQYNRQGRKDIITNL